MPETVHAACPIDNTSTELDNEEMNSFIKEGHSVAALNIGFLALTISNLRPSWDIAGIEAALSRAVATFRPDPLLLTRVALGAALDPSVGSALLIWMDKSRWEKPVTIG